jgi:DNA-binding transcriptional regulator YdaS (Cro superfamily)
MKLLLWVHLAGGPTVAARELGVGRWLLWRWLSGQQEPTFLQMAEIYRVTQGAVTKDDIAQPRTRYTGHCPACGRTMSKSEYADMRRKDHGLSLRGGGKRGSGRKKRLAHRSSVAYPSDDSRRNQDKSGDHSDRDRIGIDRSEPKSDEG